MSSRTEHESTSKLERSHNVPAPHRHTIDQRMSAAKKMKAGLERVKLGATDYYVTKVCLGTMTWGVQNTEVEAHEQLDYAIKERGVNFIDTAEMYPVPSSAPNWKPGTTETYIGTWLAKNPDLRKDIVIATKVSGFCKDSETVGNRAVTLDGAPTGTKGDGRLDRESILKV